MINYKNYFKKSLLTYIVLINLFGNFLLLSAKENFWIGLRLPIGHVSLSGLQNYLDHKITKIKPIKFKPVKYPHITFIEGEITNPKVKKKIDLILKQETKKFNGKCFNLKFYKNKAQMLGNPANKNFLVLTVDTNKSKNIFDLAYNLRKKLINLKNKIGGFKVNLYGGTQATPPLLHTSLGKINPAYNALNINQKNKLDNLIKQIDPHSKTKSPKLSKSLKNFRANEIAFSVTPSKQILNVNQLVSPQYVYGKYKI